MTPDEYMLLAGGLVALSILVAAVFLGSMILKASRRVAKAVHEKPVIADAHLESAAHLRRIALATEAFNGNDKLVADREHVSGQLEQFVIAFDEVTRAEFPADPAVRPDVAIGEERGVERVKDLLRQKIAEITAS